MKRRRVLLVVGAVIAVLALIVVGVGAWYRPLLMTGTGYAAHNACAVQFIADRGADAAADDLPPNPLVPYLRASADDSDTSVTASILGLGFRQTAYYTPAGCVIADERPEFTGPQPLSPRPQVPWPLGDKVSPHDEAATIDQILDDVFNDPATATRAFVVVHDGKIVAERYADGFTAETPQVGWSMGKSIATMMAGRLAKESGFDLNQDNLFPEWADDDRSRITVDQLLRMTSGLEWNEEYELGTPITQMLFSEPDMGAYVASQPLEAPPGTKQEYSSGSTNVACRAFHESSGMGTEMAQELVFKPLGMASAIMEADASGHLVCSSNVWATPRDWAKYGLWALQGGEWDGKDLLPADFSQDMLRIPAYEESDSLGFAAAWRVNDLPDGTRHVDGMPKDTFWTSGHDGQWIFVVPSADLVLVRLGFDPTVPTLEPMGNLAGKLAEALT